MIETVYTLSRSQEKTIEKVVLDENLHYLHMILNPGEGLPEHTTNAPVYMTVLRGTLTISLEGEEPREYNAGTLLKIPYHTKMNARNENPGTLELTVVKAPAPKA